MHQARHKLLRQDDIFYINGIDKEWSNLLVAESCYAATYSGDKEREFGVLFGKADERIHVGFDGINATLHGGNGVCPALQTDAFTPYGTKPIVSQPCCTRHRSSSSALSRAWPCGVISAVLFSGGGRQRPTPFIAGPS